MYPSTVHRFSLLFAAFLIGLLAPDGARSDPGVCNIAQESISSASEIRGLKILRPVPCKVHDKDQVKEFLLEQIHKKATPEKLANESEVAKAIGFIPEEFDYVNGLVELYLSQLGGYYDPERKHFVMAKWLPDMMQPTIAVHEMTHALQDQYFDLKNFVDEKKYSTDELLARSAPVEGDATAVMLDYQRRMLHQPELRKEDNVDSFIMQSVLGMSLSTGASAVPESLKMMLIFPYASGTRFAHQLLKEGGYAKLTAALGRPPRSTEEILHPEKYFKEKPDFVVVDDKSLLQDGERSVYSDSVGEFIISAVLNSCAADRSKAPAAAAGWGGDRILIAETGGKRIVRWKVLWDSPADADQFFALYTGARCASAKRTVKRMQPKEILVDVVR